MTLSHGIRKRFVKDVGIPIQVLQDPYFHYSLDLLNKDFGCFEEYKKFQNLVERVGGEEAFYKESSRIVDTAIDSIKDKEAFSRLQTDKIIVPQNNIVSETLYQEKNHGKTFVSIDIVKANFNALKYYDNSFLPDTYELFMKQFTNEEYFIKSKYIRQIIFGNVLPKKINSIQKVIISEIASKLDGFEIKTSSTDEIVIETENIELIKEKLKNSFDFLRIEKFYLNNFLKDFYVREYEDKVEFKQCPTIFFLQIYKAYNNLPITENDRKFYYEKMLATFDKSILE